MSDLIFLAIVVAFSALAVGLMRACAHIIGPDEAAASNTPTNPTSAEVAA